MSTASNQSAANIPLDAFQRSQDEIDRPPFHHLLQPIAESVDEDTGEVVVRLLRIYAGNTLVAVGRGTNTHSITECMFAISMHH